MGMAKIYFTFSLMLFATVVCNAQNYSSPTLNDFDKLAGNWHGTLTYLDYSTGKPFTMPADLKIGRIAKTNKFSFSNSYPKESNANSIDTMTVAADGKYIDRELIKSRKKLQNGAIQLITEELGKDGNDNKQAILRHTYTFAKNTFSKRKDVQFVGETQWINRNEYLYHKIPKRKD